MELPELKTERTVTSWRDGVYFADMKDEKNPKRFRCAFFPYSEGRLKRDVQSCQYIDKPWDRKEYKEYMDIDTPLKKILETQGYDKEGQSFVFAMFGRLIFEPGKYDQWEVIPMLWGKLVPANHRASMRALGFLMRVMWPHWVTRLKNVSVCRA